MDRWMRLPSRWMRGTTSRSSCGEQARKETVMERGRDLGTDKEGNEKIVEERGRKEKLVENGKRTWREEMREEEE